MGYTDEDFDRAKAVQERNGKYYKALYDQAGNSIAVPIFESIFRKIILHEVAEARKRRKAHGKYCENSKMQILRSNDAD